MASKENVVDKTRVFVVHGRNEQFRKSMFNFLRSIGLRPIEWSQAIQMTGKASPFIGEILDSAFQNAQAVVVLLTGDDEARLHPRFYKEEASDNEKILTPQARPNVLFEAGLAIGRFPDRTILVEIGTLRPFSDIAGRHLVRLNNSVKTRQELGQRLSTAGCLIDLSGTDWHQSGNFDIERKSWSVQIDSAGHGGIDSEDNSGGGIRIKHISDIVNLLDCINKVLKDGNPLKFVRSDGIEIFVNFSSKKPNNILISLNMEDGNWIRIHKDEIHDFRNALRVSLSSLI